MKFKYSIMVAATAVALVGCNRDNTVDKPSVSGQDVKDSVKDAAVTTKDYAVQTKDQFVASMDVKMKELDAKIDKLSAKSADYKDDAKVQADKALADLREQRAALGKKYDDLKASSQDTWDKTKAGFQSAWDDMVKAYDNAKAKFTN